MHVYKKNVRAKLQLIGLVIIEKPWSVSEFESDIRGVRVIYHRYSYFFWGKHQKEEQNKM